LGLITVLAYPRVFEVLINMLIRRNIIKPFRHADIVVFMVVSALLTYCYIFEPSTLPSNFQRAINNFAFITKGEATAFATVSEQTSRNIQ